MVVTTLALSALFGILEGLVFLYVGLELRKRSVAGEAARAWSLFILWWLALGAVVLVGGLQSLAGSLGVANLGVTIALTYVIFLVVPIALWGLVYYLGYLFTGQRAILAPLTAFYAAVLVGLVYYVTVQQPYDVSVGTWSVQVKYREPVGFLGTLLLVLGIVVPEFLAGILYGTLYFKVKDRSRRYRIAVVSVSTTLWFGSSLVSSLAGLSSSDTWQVGSKLIGLAAALAILAAYRPPGWVRRRGISALAEPVP